MTSDAAAPKDWRVLVMADDAWPLIPDGHYDIIVIGSGIGGAALAQRLAPSGKEILILERGDWLRRSPDNWSATAVFVSTTPIKPTKPGATRRASHSTRGLHYFVGGNSKMYGAALFRQRDQAAHRVRVPDCAGKRFRAQPEVLHVRLHTGRHGVTVDGEATVVFTVFPVGRLGE